MSKPSTRSPRGQSSDEWEDDTGPSNRVGSDGASDQSAQSQSLKGSSSTSPRRRLVKAKSSNRSPKRPGRPPRSTFDASPLSDKPLEQDKTEPKTSLKASGTPPLKSSIEGSRKRSPQSATSKSSSKSALGSALSMLSGSLSRVVRLIHYGLHPLYPYVLLIMLLWSGLSALAYAFWTVIPPSVFRIPGTLARLAFSSSAPLSDIEAGQVLLFSPSRAIATPACALTGQSCALSYLSTLRFGSENQTAVSAKPFWQWKFGGEEIPVIDMGELARSSTKEVQGANDIFQSLEHLGGGDMWNRSEHLRIWELATAIQVGSKFDEREVVAAGLRELGHTVEDLSYEMVETNALAVVSFQWLIWEFESLLKDLSAPPDKQPHPRILAKKLNALLTRLSTNMDKSHELASRAYVIAQRGSTQGQQIRENSHMIVADLREAQDTAPGWKLIADKANRFFVGGEMTKVERISKDLGITDTAFRSLSVSVKQLETTRMGIKAFKDQIGYFDTNLMGFHSGAGEHVGIGPEEEVRVSAQVVEEFASSLGRIKGRGQGDETRQIEGS